MGGAWRPGRVQTSLPEHDLDQFLHTGSDVVDNFIDVVVTEERPVLGPHRVQRHTVTALEQLIRLPHRSLRTDTSLVDDRTDGRVLPEPRRHLQTQPGRRGHVVQRHRGACLKAVRVLHVWMVPRAVRRRCDVAGGGCLSAWRWSLIGYRPAVGVRNYLIEGVSGAGKTSVCKELRRRGLHAVNGDTELAYQGDPETGAPSDDLPSHWHHIWNVDRVRALVADQSERFTFFCGGSRNFSKFLDLFDGVFVLEIDLKTLHARLDERPDDEFGAQQSDRDLIVRLHQSGEDTPRNGMRIDATGLLAEVVDEVIRHANAIDRNEADPS